MTSDWNPTVTQHKGFVVEYLYLIKSRCKIGRVTFRHAGLGMFVLVCPPIIKSLMQTPLNPIFLFFCILLTEGAWAIDPVTDTLIAPKHTLFAQLDDTWLEVDKWRLWKNAIVKSEDIWYWRYIKQFENSRNSSNTLEIPKIIIKNKFSVSISVFLISQLH